MTYFLCTAVGIPAVGFGVLFQNGGEVVLGLLALGMALLGWVARHEWHLYRTVNTIAHRPQGQMRIGLAIYDVEDEEEAA